MNMMKGRVEDNIMDVITPQQYFQSPNMYVTNAEYTAVMSNGLLYPIRTGSTRIEPGFYPSDVYGRYVDPAPQYYPQYQVEGNVIDFNNVGSLRDAIAASQDIQAIERQILTTPDNIFIPNISENDSPIMRGLKMAVISKEMDLDKYKYRMPQFTNDRRLFNTNDITLQKGIGFFEAFDIKATLVLEDKSPNVANPMGKVISIELTSPLSEDVI